LLDINYFYEVNDYFLKPFQEEMNENPLLLYYKFIETFKESLTPEDFESFSVHLGPIEKNKIEELYMKDEEQFAIHLLTLYYSYLDILGFDTEEITEEDIYDPLKEKILSCFKKRLVN
jgi:hypothetical protein